AGRQDVPGLEVLTVAEIPLPDRRRHFRSLPCLCLRLFPVSTISTVVLGPGPNLRPPFLRTYKPSVTSLRQASPLVPWPPKRRCILSRVEGGLRMKGVRPKAATALLCPR